MAMEITFELSDADLAYFRETMRAAREKSTDLGDDQIVANAQRLIEKIAASDASDFIRERMHRLETLIGMAEDSGWGLEEQDRTRVLQALSYFAEAQDLIPDDVPGLGFLDDAIMIEIVCRDLKHEIQAYRDFCVYRAADANRQARREVESGRSDWLEERRKQLHSRMRRRRDGGSGSSSPFSLF
jgi:hypothetical protein